MLEKTTLKKKIEFDLCTLIKSDYSKKYLQISFFKIWNLKDNILPAKTGKNIVMMLLALLVYLN